MFAIGGATPLSTHGRHVTSLASLSHCARVPAVSGRAHVEQVPSRLRLINFVATGVLLARRPPLVTPSGATGIMYAMPSNRNLDLPQRSLLVRAIRAGDVDTVRRLLEDGCSPDGEGVMSPLGHAAKRGDLEITRLLIADGANVAWTHRFTGWSALTIADANESWALAEELEAAGASKERRLAHGYTSLHRAARRGDVEQALLGIESGAIDALDANGDTPLVLAIGARSETSVRSLLRAGADPNHENDGFSVLCDAAYEDSVLDQDTDFVGLLIAAGADPNPAGYPPLFMAVNQEGSSASVLRRLVASGADISAVTPADGETILHRIVSIAERAMIDAAMECGAKIEARDARGRTPLLTAASQPSVENFVRLASLGADLGARDTAGRNARDLLEDVGDDEAASVLLRLLAASEHDPGAQ